MSFVDKLSPDPLPNVIELLIVKLPVIVSVASDLTKLLACTPSTVSASRPDPEPSLPP